jgi:hypothetical protein
MHSLKFDEKRGSARRRQVRAARILLGAGAVARDCLVLDISDGGVRLDVGGLDVPDEFVLLLSDDGVVRESAYQVVWRRGHEVGAKFVSVVRSGFALQDQFPLGNRQ